MCFELDVVIGDCCRWYCVVELAELNPRGCYIYRGSAVGISISKHYFQILALKLTSDNW